MTTKSIKAISTKYAAASFLVLGLAATTGVGTVFAASDELNERGHNNKGGKLTLAAELLGTTVDDLKARLEGGEDVRTILENAGYDRDDIKEAKMQKKIDRLNEAVASGKITQEQADERIDALAEREARMSAIKEAVSAGDFATWSALVEGKPIADIINESNFSQLTQAHELRENGDKEGAREILDDLGIEHKGNGKHKGWSERGERSQETGFKPQRATE